MATESDTTAARRCDSQETKISSFVPPRPRYRYRPKKGDNKAGYWCRRTAILSKEVAVANREARETKVVILAMQEQIRVVQEAHDKQSQQAQEQIEEMKQLLVTSLEQGAHHREEMVRIVQEAHHTQSQQAQKQSQQAQEQMEEMKQLLATSLKQSVQQFSVAQEQVADTQELLAVPEQVADAQEPLAPLAP